MCDKGSNFFHYNRYQLLFFLFCKKIVIFASEMGNIGQNMRKFMLWVMLTTVAIAYTGKALHTHDKDYYQSLKTTQNAASNGMSDSCPICHFNLVFFSLGDSHAFAFYIVLLTVFFAVQPLMRSIECIKHYSLRAPPVGYK